MFKDLSKEEKEKLLTKYYTTKTGLQNKKRFMRIKLSSIFLIIYSIILLIDNSTKNFYIYYISLSYIIFAIVLIILSSKTKQKLLNEFYKKES